MMDSPYIQVLPFLFRGLGWTLLITFSGLAVGFWLGAAAGLARVSRPGFFRGAATVYVEVIRGTPILAQIFLVYFGLSDLFGINMPNWLAAILAIAINSGAYIAEIVRGTVQSIDPGQREAGRSLGLSSQQTMRFVIWPQAMRRMIPPLGNQFIISLKDTSLFSVIAVGEILFQTRQYYNRTFAPFEALTMACLFYLMITIPSSIYLRRMEHRMEGK
ncbi:MAG: amino acid ABC transporter permease [Verrucomicrobia bacterium]|nr:amino acid ABC transporter permease [Verrucomicrobiota bacterium]MCH8513041.1 amino acid ABC transporter permease [Kiritimatiellia bacterium]